MLAWQVQEKESRAEFLDLSFETVQFFLGGFQLRPLLGALQYLLHKRLSRLESEGKPEKHATELSGELFCGLLLTFLFFSGILILFKYITIINLCCSYRYSKVTLTMTHIERM